MSNQALQTQDPPYVAAIKKSEKRFNEVAHGMPVNYDRECIFAMQALMKNDFAMKTANNNPQSVQLAMINIGSTGLTLNPANAYAYLVPRDGSVLLDISYKGLIKIATDSGAILWARADIVYGADTFKYHGPAKMPEHSSDPFSGERGDVVGCYCIAKTRDGDILTEVMPMSELDKIRNASTAYKKAKKGPWVDWFEQMAKKAVIKRASKTWPYTDDRLAQAVEVASTSEGGYALDEGQILEIRKNKCNEAVANNIDSVQLIKDSIESEDYYAGAEAWYELDQETQEALWLAPTKGGCFTTQERSTIKSEFWNALHGSNSETA